MPQLCTPTCDEKPISQVLRIHQQKITFSICKWLHLHKTSGANSNRQISGSEHHRTLFSATPIKSQPCGCPFWPPQRPETHWPLIKRTPCLVAFCWPGHQKKWRRMSKFGTKKNGGSTCGFGPRLISGYFSFFFSGPIKMEQKIDGKKYPKIKKKWTPHLTASWAAI